MSDTLLSISQAAKKLGVAAVTLRLWERQGKIKSLRTGGNQRRYSSEMLDKFKIQNSNNQINIKPQTPYTPILLTTLISPFQKQVLAWTLAVVTLAGGGAGIYKYSGGNGEGVNKILGWFGKNGNIAAANTEYSEGSVLAAETVNDDYRFVINVPSLFNKNITAPNIIYGLTAGTNVTITGGQNPTINATDQTTDLKIFKTVKVGSTEISAGSKTDTLEFVAGSNITLSTNTSDKKITIAASSTDITTSGWTDDGAIVRLTTAGNLVSLGAASGAARLNLNVDDDTDLLTASKSGNLKFKLNSNGVITSGTWQGTAVANAYLANSAVTVTAGTGLSGGGSVSLGNSITLSSTLGTSVDLTSEVTGVLPIANGGTNLSTYTTGDILYSSATNTLSKLAVGTAGQVLTVTGGVPVWAGGLGGTGTVGYWQRSSGGVLAPDSITDDLAIGGTSTASALFKVSGTTGNIITSGTLTLPNSNTLTGQTGNIQLSGGVSVGGGTTYYVNTSGNANFNTLNAATTTLGGTTVTSLLNSGSASVSGGLILYGVTTVSTTGMQTLNLGDSSTGNIVTSRNISATGTLTGLTGLTVASGTVSLPAGQIDSTELVGTDIATVGTITSGIWNSTAIGPLYGGTGQTTWTTGDLLYASGTNTLAKRGIGSAGQVLTVSGGVPTWTDTTSVGNWQRADGAVSPLNITDDVLVGATSTASAKIALNANSGLLTTTLFKLTTSPGSGYALVSDASGNGSWTDLATSGTAGPWTLSGSTTFPDTASYNVLIGSATVSDDIGKLTVSGAKAGKALVVLNQTAEQNILVASASGVTKFVLDNTGTVTTGIWNGTAIDATHGGTNQTTWTTGDILYASGTNTLAKLGIGSTSQVLTVSGGVPSWGAGASSSNWQRNSGAIAPLNITDDLLVGGISTASAKFTVVSSSGNTGISGTLTLPNTNVLTGVSGYLQAGAGISVGGGTTYYINNLGTANLNAATINSTLGVTGATTLTGALTANSTASVSGALTLFGTPTIASTAKQSLTLGDTNTGNIIFSGGNVGIGTTGPGSLLHVSKSQAADTVLTVSNTNAGQARAIIRATNDDSTGNIQIIAGGTGYTAVPSWQDSGVLYNEGALSGGMKIVTATGDIRFSASALEAGDMVIKATSGNVGIGTTSPLTALQIVGSASESANFSMYGQGTAHTFNILNAGTLNIQRSVGGDAGLATSLFVDAAGNVGIGTTGPGYKLHVYGTDPNLFLQASGGNGERILFGYSGGAADSAITNNAAIAGGFEFRTGGVSDSTTTRLAITSTGNVGIGTTGPGATLDVNGNVKVGTNLGVGGLPTATDAVSITRSLTGTGLTGINNTPSLTYSSASTNAIGIYTKPSFTVNTGVAVTSAYGLWLDAPTVTLNGTGTLTNNYGLYVSTPTGATNNYGLFVNGGTTVLNATDGNVGIGTTGPNHVLTVGSTETPIGTGARAGFYFAGNSYLLTRDTTNDVESNFGSYDSTSVGFGSVTNHAVHLITNNTQKVTILANGNVGIGTTSPLALLDVAGSASMSANLSLRGTGTSHQVSILDGGNLAFLTSVGGGAGTEMVRITNSGNVGIGTTGPLTKLHVTGSSATNVDVLTLENSDITSNVTRSVTQNFVGRDTVGNQKTIASIWSRVDQINANDGSLHFGTRNANTFYSDRMAIDTSGNVSISAGTLTVSGTGNSSIAGNVGIGTTAPDALLDVNGLVALRSQVSVGSAPDYLGAALAVHTVTTGSIGEVVKGLAGQTGDLQQWRNSDDTVLVTVKSSGNVGIGTTSPLALLDVNGTASVSGALSLYGTPTIAATAMKTLTLGGSTTGNIVIDSGTGVVNVADLTASRAIFTDASSNLTSTGASADLLNSLSDETGTGVAVFGTSPAITTSLTTGSTTFALVNTTATTVNFAGAATTLSIGAGTGTSTVNNTLIVSGSLTANGAFTLGDNGDTGAIDTSDWNINSTGDLSGIGSIAADGNITQSGATTFTTGTGTVTVAGAATVSASLALGPQSAAPDTCNAANEGRIFYFGTSSEKKLYFCNGTSWTALATGLAGVSYQTISPEFPGGVISADGSNNTGTFTSDREATGSGSLYSFNYYEFSTGQTSLQDYDIYLRWEVPENFSSWATSNAITIDYATEDTSSANNKVDIQITKENDADTVTSSSNVSPTAGKWQSNILSSSPISFTSANLTSAITWAAGDIAVIRIRLFSKDNYFARVGAIKFDWQ